MSAPVALPAGCCAPQCSDTVTANIPGPKGDAGTNGTNGTNGQNAWTLTTAAFTMPAIAANVNLTVQNSDWISNGQILYVTVAGYFKVVGLVDSLHVLVENLGYTGNIAPTTLVPAPQKVSPAGIKGTDGIAVGVTFDSISPTTTKGDLIGDNGANTPLASNVRLGVGTNGKALVADSTQPAGLNYATITPNTVANDNNIPRFDGTTGTPMPLQDSKLLITDDGAIQSTPSGGNARGSKAVDLQVQRSAATMVASGANSVVGGGANNTASGAAAVVSGGNGNTASGNDSSVAGGISNTASGANAAVSAGNNNAASNTNSFVGGGNGNTASGTNAVVSAGVNNVASGTNASVGGGSANTASGACAIVPGGSGAAADKYGQSSHAAGPFAAAGDSQVSELLWRIATTDATPTELFLDGAASRATVPLNTTWGGKLLLVGRSSAGVGAVWEVTFGVQNNANTVTLVAAVAVSVLSDGTSGTWGVAGTIAVTADNVNKSLKLVVTGPAATNVRWTAAARFVEVSY